MTDALLSAIIGSAVSNRSVIAIGDVRPVSVLPKYDIQLLIDGCINRALIVNPNASPGCSPILRALIDMSGLPYAVSREIANDGEDYGHQGGNAIDVAAISTVPSTNSHIPLAAICTVLRQVPALFASVVHHDPDFPDEDLFILDGAVVAASAYGGIDSPAVAEGLGRIHIASSVSRFASAVTTSSIRTLLGPASSPGSVHAGDTQTDRSVSVAIGDTVPIVALAVDSDQANRPSVNYW